MTGILLLAVLSFWTWLCWRVARMVGGHIRHHAWRTVGVGLAFFLLLPIPLADELVGGFQFRALCAQPLLNVPVMDVAGRVARFSANPSNSKLSGTAIPIFHTHVEYRDANTSELIASYDSFVA